MKQRVEIDTAIKRVLDSGKFILDKEVEIFEKEFASYCNVDYAVGCANGTEALYLAFKALGIGQGDEVITVSHTSSATICAIRMTGAMPIYTDIEERSYLINPDLIKPTKKTKAIVPVHLYGGMCDMAQIGKFGLPIVEDCAQSVGAGNLYGKAGAYSFYPTKNLGGIGDGGCVITDSRTLAHKVRAMREYGYEERFISKIDGINSRLDEIQAAVLRVKLKYLDKELKRRWDLATFYWENLKDTDLILPELKGTFHQYVIRHKKRDELVKVLGAQIHYPVPCHLQLAYKQEIHLPVTEKVCKEILSLPMKIEIDEAKEVCKKIKEII